MTGTTSPPCACCQENGCPCTCFRPVPDCACKYVALRHRCWSQEIYTAVPVPCSPTSPTHAPSCLEPDVEHTAAPTYVLRCRLPAAAPALLLSPGRPYPAPLLVSMCNKNTTTTTTITQHSACKAPSSHHNFSIQNMLECVISRHDRTSTIYQCIT